MDSPGLPDWGAFRPCAAGEPRRMETQVASRKPSKGPELLSSAGLREPLAVSEREAEGQRGIA